VKPTLKQATLMDAAINFDKYPIELLYQAVRPLYEPGSDVRITSIEINRRVDDSMGEKSDIVIKGETSTNNNTLATRYGIKVKTNMKDYTWDPIKIDPPRDGKFSFQITGTYTPADATSNATAQH
jgi:hypothetical protein